MPSPFPCSPVIRQCSWKKTQIEKKKINEAREFHVVFQAPLDYSSLYRSMHFWCHDTTPKKIFSIEKLNLTWNKQTNFNKLGPLPRFFQIALRGRGMGNLPGTNFFIGWWESGKEWFWPLKTFFKTKNNIQLILNID